MFFHGFQIELEIYFYPTAGEEREGRKERKGRKKGKKRRKEQRKEE